MINNNVLVSISCITFNHAAYIRQCLDGFILQKTNFVFEVNIHDDASTDGTADIIREYEKKYPEIIKPIFQIENQFSKYGLEHIYQIDTKSMRILCKRLNSTTKSDRKYILLSYSRLLCWMYLKLYRRTKHD